MTGLYGLRSPLKGKLRRATLALLRPGYVRAQQQKRRGRCRMCGACCRLVFRCPFLTSDNRCRIYTTGRPANCRVFPVDERDLADVHWRCGFHFDGAGKAEE